MTKILLSGMALATVLFVLGMSAQSFAMPIPDKTQNTVPSYTLTKDATQQLMLTCDSPTIKGGKATCHLGPKPQAGIDGIPISKAAEPPTMLVSEPVTSKRGIAVLHLVPRPPHSSWDSVS